MSGVDIDLDAARLAFLGQEFRVGKARADHQQRVAVDHQLVARLGAEQADRAGDPGQIVRQRRLAEQRLGDAGAEPVGDRDDLVGGAQRAGADQDRDLLAGVEHVGGAPQVGLVGHDLAAPRSRRRNAPCRAPRRLLVGISCRSLGRTIAVTRRSRQRDADGAVDEMAHLRRRGGLLDERAGHILEQAGRSTSCW